MSRRPPSDTFTQFTSTTPHATKRPSTTVTYQPSSSPAAAASSSPPPPQGRPAPSQGPPGETPLQRVARLRAAHNAAKEAASYSFWDRVIERGRRVADRAHRLTAYGLILFAGVSTVVTVYGTVSLIAHSRRQKRAWVERELDRLDEARRAFLRGDADAEQLHLLEQERAGQEMESARMRAVEQKKSESYWTKVKGLVGAQAAKGEMGTETELERSQRESRTSGGRRQRATGGGRADDGWVEGEVRPVAVQVAPSGIPGVGLDSKGRPVPADRVEYVTSKADASSTPRELLGRAGGGGPLDVMAENVAGAVAPSAEGSSWLGWLRGSKS